MKHPTSVFFIILSVLVISTTQQQNKSENINDILDELIKQTESGSLNDHRKIHKSHKAEKPSNNSKIIYFKPRELSKYSDNSSNSLELNIRSIDENNKVSNENGDVMQSHEIELEIEDAIEHDKTVEDINTVARSGIPIDDIDLNLSTEIKLNKPGSTEDDNSFYPEMLLKDHGKYEESRNIIKKLLSDLGDLDPEEQRSAKKKDNSDIELQVILEQLFKNYAVEEVLPNLDIMKVDRVPNLEELLAQYEYLNQQMAYIEKIPEPNVYPNPIGVPAMFPLPLTPTVVRTVIHHPPPQVMYPPSPHILGNPFPTGQRCCRLH